MSKVIPYSWKINFIPYKDEVDETVRERIFVNMNRGPYMNELYERKRHDYKEYQNKIRTAESMEILFQDYLSIIVIEPVDQRILELKLREINKNIESIKKEEIAQMAIKCEIPQNLTLSLEFNEDSSKISNLILDIINSMVYYSDIMSHYFAEIMLQHCLLENYSIYESIDDKILFWKILSNMIADISVNELKYDIGEIIKLAETELFHSDDSLMEESCIWFLSNLSKKNELNNDQDSYLLNVFINVLVPTKMAVCVKDAFVGIFYEIAKNNSFATNEIVEIALSFLSQTLSMDSLYNNLTVINILFRYNETPEAFIDIIDLEILVNYSYINKEKVRMASMELIDLLIIKIPPIISSLQLSNFYTMLPEYIESASCTYLVKQNVVAIIADTIIYGVQRDIEVIIKENLLIHLIQFIGTESGQTLIHRILLSILKCHETFPTEQFLNDEDINELSNINIPNEEDAYLIEQLKPYYM